MTEVLENMTPNWQTPSQVSSAPMLKYFSCPHSMASQLQLKNLQVVYRTGTFSVKVRKYLSFVLFSLSRSVLC